MVSGAVEGNLDTYRRLVDRGNSRIRSSRKPQGASWRYGNSLLDRGLQYFSRLDAQLLHAGDQRRTFDVHACCGAVRACYPPVRDFQDADNLIPLIDFALIHRKNGPAILAQFADRGLQ